MRTGRFGFIEGAAARISCSMGDDLFACTGFRRWSKLYSGKRLTSCFLLVQQISEFEWAVLGWVCLLRDESSGG